ncbi:helix-turn-helix domain-containing protein [Actinoalloteichus hymeniacidonis]|nr:helix-turn-helix transcriptional regulator [Actinoalloteichus hymeniacidonis]MBB5910441.1 transcriptional regulator with XRE-family HTH domain [Actinoalloteichus hymeniacidonis]
MATPKSLALANELRRHREAAGASARQLSLQAGLSHSTVARWESNVRAPSPTDLAAVLALLGVDATTRDELIAMATDVDGRQWVATGLPEQARALRALLEAERDACRVVTVAPLLVPGMLQTSDYARAIFTAGDVPDEEIETRVRTRVGRRENFTGRRATELVAILGEAALRRPIGGPETQIDQLYALIDLADLPAVDLRVIALSCPWSPDLEGAFDLFDFPDDRDSVVCVEHRRSSLFLHERRDVDAYRAAVANVMNVAMSPVDSTGLIGDIIKEMEKP